MSIEPPHDASITPLNFSGTMGPSSGGFPQPFDPGGGGLPARYYRRIRPGYWLLALVFGGLVWCLAVAFF